MHAIAMLIHEAKALEDGELRLSTDVCIPCGHEIPALVQLGVYRWQKLKSVDFIRYFIMCAWDEWDFPASNREEDLRVLVGSYFGILYQFHSFFFNFT